MDGGGEWNKRPTGGQGVTKTDSCCFQKNTAGCWVQEKTHTLLWHLQVLGMAVGVVACHDGLLGAICQARHLKHLLLVAASLQEAQGLDHLLLVTACLQEAQGPDHLLQVTACLIEAQAAAAKIPEDPKMQWMKKMKKETQMLLPLTSWRGQGGTTTGATEPPLGGN